MHITLFEGFAGGGTTTRALVDGLRRHATVTVAGLSELEGAYLQHASAAHPESSTFRGSFGAFHPAELSVSFNGIRYGHFGIPCRGASKAGKSKNRIATAEQHKDVGYLFLPTIHFIRQHRLDVVSFENVPEYKDEESAEVLRAALRVSGYALTEWVVDAHTQFRTATQRVRWVMVASRLGKFEWHFEAQPFSGTIEGLLDAPSALDDDESATTEQVQAFETYIGRKAAEGCGFRTRFIDHSSTRVPTLAHTYGKRQPSATFVKTPKSFRMLRPHEVRAIHGFPADFALPTTKTTAYEILGQGVCYEPFRALGDALGAWLAARGSSVAAVVPLETPAAPRATVPARAEQVWFSFAA